jgi:hypothetical protein
MADFSRFATALPFAAVAASTPPATPPSPEPPAAPEASPTLPPAGNIRSSLLSSVANLRNLGDRAVIPSLVDPFVSRGEGSQMWTRLAHSAFAVLSDSTRDILDAALNTFANKAVKAPDALRALETAPVSYQEILAELAEGWSAKTKEDFAKHFSMPVDQLKVMDAMVSLAVLNSPSLEGLLRQENTTTPTANDLLENRRVIWQSPPPGTVMEPPYVILLAVEHIDSQSVKDVVQSILGELVEWRGFKLPRVAAQRLQ